MFCNNLRGRQNKEGARQSKSTARIFLKVSVSKLQLFRGCLRLLQNKLLFLLTRDPSILLPKQSKIHYNYSRTGESIICLFQNNKSSDLIKWARYYNILIFRNVH